MSRILITGGAGFGGSGLVKALLERGYEVSVLDMTGPLHADNLLPYLDDIRYIWKAIHDIRPEDIEGHNIVVHLQAQADVPMGFGSPYWTAHQNVMGTVALLEAARHVSLEKLIYAGSGNEWGRPAYLPIDEKHPLTPHNPYSFSKAAAELACWAWWRSYEVPIVIMSNGIVCGELMRREIFIYKWLWNIAHDRPVVLEGGDQTRDVTHVSDVVDAWMRVIQRPSGIVVGQKFQVSYGEEHTVRELLEMCFEVAGRRVPIIERPHRPGEEGQRECFDNSKARRVLGYSPKVLPKEAIRLTWEWMAAREASHAPSLR